MKKVFQKRLLFSLVLSLLLIYFFSIVFVFAQETIPTPKPEGGQTNFDVVFGDLAKRIQDAFSGVSPFSIPNFSRILLGILLWMILYSIFKSMNIFESKARWSGGVALIVTILAFMYIPEGLITAISIEYGALGATVITVIPFAIAVYFTVWVSTNFLIARAIWLVFGLYYGVILVYTAFSAPAPKGVTTIGEVLLGNPGLWFYVVAFIASAILFWFIVPINEIIWKEHLKSVEGRINRNISEFGLGLRTGKRVAREAYRGEGGLGGVG